MLGATIVASLIIFPAAAHAVEIPAPVVTGTLAAQPAWQNAFSAAPAPASPSDSTTAVSAGIEAALSAAQSESAGLTMSSKMRAMPSAAIQSMQSAAGQAMQSARDITDSALDLIGVRYKFGGQSPERGMDCSGFVRYVFEQVTGVTLPRSARDQAKVGESVEIDELKPGDLVFFNTRKHAFSHVGIYLGDNTFIHSPNKKGSVRVTSIDGRYWKHRFNGARRLLGVLPGLASMEAAKAVLKSLPTGSIRNDDPPE